MEITKFPIGKLVRNWIRKFNSGIDSVQDASRSGRPRTAVTPKNMSKVNKILDSEIARMPVFWKHIRVRF